MRSVSQPRNRGVRFADTGAEPPASIGSSESGLHISSLSGASRAAAALSADVARRAGLSDFGARSIAGIVEGIHGIAIEKPGGLLRHHPFKGSGRGRVTRPPTLLSPSPVAGQPALQQAGPTPLSSPRFEHALDPL